MNRGVAQLAECALWEREVPSSNLGAPTRLYIKLSSELWGRRGKNGLAKHNGILEMLHRASELKKVF